MLKAQSKTRVSSFQFRADDLQHAPGSRISPTGSSGMTDEGGAPRNSKLATRTPQQKSRPERGGQNQRVSSAGIIRSRFNGRTRNHPAGSLSARYLRAPASFFYVLRCSGSIVNLFQHLDRCLADLRIGVLHQRSNLDFERPQSGTIDFFQFAQGLFANPGIPVF